MSFIAVGVGVAAIAVSVYGQVKAGQAQNAADQSQAAIGEHNAQNDAEEGEVKLQNQQRNAAQTIGTAQTQYAANGIDTGSGSALDTINNSMSQALRDSNQLAYETNAKVQSDEMGAASESQAGDAAESGADLAAAGSALSSASSIYAGGAKAGWSRT